MEPTSGDVIRSFVAREYIEPARRKGAKSVQVIAGDVHRGLRLKNRVPNVCSVLGSKMLLRRTVWRSRQFPGPPSGMGTRVTYTYRLLDNNQSPKNNEGAIDFARLRGLLKGALQTLGGGEAFLGRERERFYHHAGAEKK